MQFPIKINYLLIKVRNQLSSNSVKRPIYNYVCMCGMVLHEEFYLGKTATN